MECCVGFVSVITAFMLGLFLALLLNREEIRLKAFF